MAYTTQIYFLVLLEDGSLRLVCQHGWVLVRALFLACRWLLSHCIHTCDSNGAISSPSSYKATILVHSLNFNYLLKTLSHAVTLGVRASTYTRKTWEHNSVHSNIKGDSRAHRAPFSPAPRHPSLQIWHLSESTDPFVLFSGQQIVFLVLCQHLFFL